jgi:hypothetical protein
MRDRFSSSTKAEYEPTRTGLSPETLVRAMRDNLGYTQGRVPEMATQHEIRNPNYSDFEFRFDPKHDCNENHLPLKDSMALRYPAC